MTFNYKAIAEKAKAQIANFGRDVKIIYNSQGKYNPQTDSISNKNMTEATVKAVMLNFKRTDFNGTLIKVGDKLLLIASDGIDTPRTKDIIVDNGEEYSIVSVEELQPASDPLLYKLQIRK